MAPRPRRVRGEGQLDAGPFAADIASFRLHLVAESKAAGTIRIYTDAACWLAASHLLTETDKARWDQVDAADVRRWVAWLLSSGPCSSSGGWRSEENLPSPMANSGRRVSELTALR